MFPRRNVRRGEPPVSTAIHYRATFADGSVALRSTEGREYAYCWRHRPGGQNHWTARTGLIPAGAQHAKAERITAAEHRAAAKALKAQAAGGEHALKVAKARDTLRLAQREHFWCGHFLTRYASPGSAPAERLVHFQRRQARAFQRMAKARATLARLEG